MEDGEKKVFEVRGVFFLLINTNSKIYIVENRCGHFGASLHDGKLSNTSITCNQHFVEFSLLSGKVLNHSVESCDPIKVFEWTIQDQEIIINDK